MLKPGGTVWIAEVRSRFDGKDGRASIASFVEAAGRVGLASRRAPDESNAMFFTLELVKESEKRVGGAARWPSLKACEYKKR